MVSKVLSRARNGPSQGLFLGVRSDKGRARGDYSLFQKKRKIAPGTARGVSRRRTPISVLREKVEPDPDKYVALWEKAAAEGRDVRALSAIFKMIYEDDVAHVDVPHTFDEVKKLEREERRALMRQLEREGMAPFVADDYRNGKIEP